MSFIQCNFQSITMHTPANVTILLPHMVDDFSQEAELDEVYVPGKKYKTLYLLHGAFSDSNSWLLDSNIQRYAQEHNLAIVLPSVGNSFYSDLPQGRHYWTFISEELPRYVQSVFPLSSKREDNYVAGLSMGGYGALKLAFNNPSRFAGVISLSGALDLVAILQNSIHPLFNVNDMYGGYENVTGTYHDLYACIDRLVQKKTSLPRIYLACGTEDSLFRMNREFSEYLNSHSIEHDFVQAVGDHDFEFWDRHIRFALDCMVG